MSYVDQPESQQRSFSQRWQEVWDHPHPFGLIALLRGLTDAVQSVPGLMDASAIATGRSPSTEEEAYRYNQAHEYVPRAAYDVAKVITPTAPRAVGGFRIDPPSRLGPAVQPRPHAVYPFSTGERLYVGRAPVRSEPPRPSARAEYDPSQLERAAASPPAVLRSGGDAEPGLTPNGTFWPQDSSRPMEMIPYVSAPPIVPGIGDLGSGAAAGGLRDVLWPEPPQAGGAMPKASYLAPSNDSGPLGGALRFLLRGEPGARPLTPADDSPPLPVPSDDVERTSRRSDPNFRELTRAPSRLQGSEGDDIVNGISQESVADANPPERPRSPLSDDHLDIPEFLRRQPGPEPTNSDREKKRTDMQQSDFSGGGNYNGDGGGGGGGGGGGREWDEDCKQERDKALDICGKALGDGFRGDGRRWKSNFSVGPFRKPAGEPPWNVRDCMRGLMSEACYGNIYERPPTPKVKRYNLRPRSSPKAKRR